MRINFLMPHLKIAGGVRLSLTYADQLAKMGHSVTVIVENRNWWRRGLANFLNLKPSWYKENRASFLRVRSWQSENIPVADILVACWWQGAETAQAYGDDKGLKFHFIQHDERLYHGPKERVEKIYANPAYRKIVISSWLKEIIKSDFGFESEILVTPVDSELFHEVDGLRKEEEIRVLLLHHNYTWKGTAAGLRVINRVKKEFPNVKAVGYGVRLKAGEDYDQYHYNLPQKKLANLYSSCDIYLCPSEYEGLGMPSMEAMACGTALVTYDTGGSRDYAFEGKTAYVAKHNDEEDLYLQLKKAVVDSEERRRIARQGKEFINQKLENWEASALRMEKILKAALSNPV